MRITRWSAVVGAVLATLLTASCATIPMSSPVQTAAPQQQEDNSVGFVPNGPAANASPGDIVSGFVRAQGAGGRYAVAKEFLTRAESRRWRPDTSVLVHTQAWTVQRDDDSEVVVEVPATASVDSAGRYTTVNRSPQPLDFRLARENGQWRISKAPDGVVVSDRAFPRLFTSTTLMFFDPDYTRLIQDVRWFPVRDASDADLLLTRADIVRSLLAGQSAVLAQVTVPVFPAGTALAAPVRLSDGVTAVAVEKPGSMPDARTTERMQQALAASMGISVASLRLTVNGVLAREAQPAQVEQLSATGPVVYAGGRFGVLTSQGTVTEDRDLGAAIARLRPRAVTVSTRQQLAAVQEADGRVAVVTNGDSPGVVDRRSGLVAPTLDQRGWTYSVPRNDSTGLMAYDEKGRPVPVQGDLGGSPVIAIEVSPDGTRLLILRRSEAGAEASVAGILRSADGTPIALTTDRYPIALGGTDALDATWVDQAKIAVLVEEGAGQQVVTQQIGGLSGTLGTLSNALSIVGATALGDLRVRLRTGDLVEWSSNSWVPEQAAVDDIAMLAVVR